MPFNLKSFLLIIAVFVGFKSLAQDSLLVVNDSLMIEKESVLTTKDSTRLSIWETLKYDGTTVYKGVLYVYSSPSRWNNDDWGNFAATAIGTGILWSGDEAISDYFIKQSEDIPKAFKETGYYFGKPLINYGLTAGLYTVGLVTRNEKIRKAGVLVITSATAAGVTQTVLKNAIGRARPYAGKGPATFKPFSSHENYHSFPSGHAILSFTTAYALSKQFDNPWIKAGFLVGGSLTPVSRMWAGAHWATDVALGMIISVATVESVDRFMNSKRNYHQKPGTKISWNLNMSRNTIGVVGTF